MKAEVQKLEQSVLDRIQILVPPEMTAHPDRQRSLCFLIEETEHDFVVAMNKAIGSLVFFSQIHPFKHFHHQFS